MTSGRKRQFHHPQPSWARPRNRQFGQDSSGDYSSADYVDTGTPADVPAVDNSTTVSEVVVTPATPDTSTTVSPITVTPDQPALSPDIVLSPPVSLDLGNLVDTIIPPTIQTPTGTTKPNPLSQFLKKLFPPSKGKASGGGGGGGGGGSAPKLQTSPQIKPATTTAAAGSNQMVLWGASAAGIILLAALFSHHHHSGGGGRR